MRRLTILTLLLLAACGNGRDNAAPTPAPQPTGGCGVDAPAAQDKDKQLARRLFDESEALSVSGDNSAAAEKLERAIELSPTDGEIHARLGHVYIRLLRYDDARDALIRATELVDGEPHRQLKFLASWCSYTVASELYNKGEYDNALAESKRALDLHPDNLDARFLVGKIHFANGRYGQAIDVYAILAAQTTGDRLYQALRDMGEAQFHANEYRAAITTFTKLIDHGAEGYEAWGWRGYCYVQVGDRARAVSDFTQAVQRTDSAERRADYDEKLRQLAQVGEDK